MKVALPDIRHDLHGFNQLVLLWAKTQDCFWNDIDIDMSQVRWLDADMCAPFGAILYHLGKMLNTVQLSAVRPKVESILAKNGFLSHYGCAKRPDTWHTTIPYQRFDIKDDRYFAEYINNDLMQRREIPNMSTGLKKKFCKSIFEIFSNAVLHSKTEQGIFSCGQLFPKRHQIHFTVADLGIGIPRNVKENANLELAPERAIDWATQKGHTTKRGQIPGGLGLKLLVEFIDLNGGRIQIVSDAGYWLRANKETVTKRLEGAFPGTVVNVEINTADTQSYVLSSELSESDIF